MPPGNLNDAIDEDGDGAPLAPSAAEVSHRSAETVWQPATMADATVVIDDAVAAATVVQRDATVVRATQVTIVKARPDAASSTQPSSALRERAEAAGEATPSSVRYVVVGTAGQGGMGTVHVARDKELLRHVALKELSALGAHDPDARTRFVREVQVTAQLDHPHIVPVYSLEVAEGGRPAYAMKLVEGRTFRQLMDDTRACYVAGRPVDDTLSLATRLEHFLKVCDAIDYAHTRGVVHRDLKPANLMLGRHNEVYVMDWGICRLLTHQDAAIGAVAVDAGSTEDAGATALGTLMGTPMYMAPEQAQGRHADLDARSDLCALGLILYELVTLQRPFSGTQVQEVIQQAASGHRSPIVHAWREPIPAELEAIIERATAFDPARRYTGARALADDLRRFLRGDAVDARPDSAWEKLVRRLARRRQAVAMAVLGFALVSMATVATLIWRHERALAQEQFRERYTQTFVDEVAELGDRLQTRVLEVRGELEAMAAVVSQAAQYGREGAEPTPVAAGATNQGLFVALPGADTKATALLTARLHNVHAVQREIADRVRVTLGARSGRGAAAGDVSGLHRLIFGFDAGLAYVFPATARRSGVDPRTEGWYRTAATLPGADVHPVQADADAAEELAMSTAVRDDNGRALGAVSMVLSLDNVLTNLLADNRGSRRVHGTWILTKDGRVLAARAETPEKAALVKQLPMQELLRSMASLDVGSVEIAVLGEPHVVAFDRVHPFGWILLELAQESDLAARARQ